MDYSKAINKQKYEIYQELTAKINSTKKHSEHYMFYEWNTHNITYKIKLTYTVDTKMATHNLISRNDMEERTKIAQQHIRDVAVSCGFIRGN